MKADEAKNSAILAKYARLSGPCFLVLRNPKSQFNSIAIVARRAKSQKFSMAQLRIFRVTQYDPNSAWSHASRAKLGASEITDIVNLGKDDKQIGNLTLDMLIYAANLQKSSAENSWIEERYKGDLIAFISDLDNGYFMTKCDQYRINFERWYATKHPLEMLNGKHRRDEVEDSSDEEWSFPPTTKPKHTENTIRCIAKDDGKIIHCPKKCLELMNGDSGYYNGMVDSGLGEFVTDAETNREYYFNWCI